MTITLDEASPNNPFGSPLIKYGDHGSSDYFDAVLIPALNEFHQPGRTHSFVVINEDNGFVSCVEFIESTVARRSDTGHPFDDIRRRQRAVPHNSLSGP